MLKLTKLRDIIRCSRLCTSHKQVVDNWAEVLADVEELTSQIMKIEVEELMVAQSSLVEAAASHATFKLLSERLSEANYGVWIRPESSGFYAQRADPIFEMLPDGTHRVRIGPSGFSDSDIRKLLLKVTE